MNARKLTKKKSKDDEAKKNNEDFTIYGVLEIYY